MVYDKSLYRTDITAFQSFIIKVLHTIGLNLNYKITRRSISIQALKFIWNDFLQENNFL